MSKEFQFTYKSIITGEEIPYNAMTVRNQRQLIEILENIDSGVEEDINFIQLLKRICGELIGIPYTNLFYNDFEYLVFLIRYRTYGETIRYHLTDESGEFLKGPSDKIREFKFNILKDINVPKVKDKKARAEIKMENGDIVIISPLYCEEYFNLNLDASETKLGLELITTSLRKFKRGDDQIKEFFDINEKIEYIDKLSLKDLKRLTKNFETFPRISLNKKENVDGMVYRVSFGDMRSNFFEL